GVEASRAGGARDYIDGADILPRLRDRHAGEQELELLTDVARGKPIARSRSWSSTKCNVGTRSPQSVLTVRIIGSATMIARTWSAMLRILSTSGPLTRNATGKGDGGPKTSCVARTRAAGARPLAAARRRRSFNASRASSDGVRTMIFANDGSGSSGE